MIHRNKMHRRHWQNAQGQPSDLYHHQQKNATTDAADYAVLKGKARKLKLHRLTTCNPTLANRAQLLSSQPFVNALQGGSNFTSEMQTHYITRDKGDGA